MTWLTMVGETEETIVNGDVVVVNPETTGGRILWLRRQTAKMKQKELAAKIGVVQSYMSELEGDKREPSAAIIARIADELNTTADYLMLRTDNASPPKDAEPTFLSDEAKAAADMIDEMYPDLRAQALRAVKGIYNHYQEHAWRDQAIRELLNLIESTKGLDFRQDLERKLGLRPGLTKGSESFPRDILGNNS